MERGVFRDQAQKCNWSLLEIGAKNWKLAPFLILFSGVIQLCFVSHWALAPLLYLCIMQLLLLQPSHNQAQSLPIPHVFICLWPTQEQLLILISESQIQVLGIVSIWLALLGVSVELCSHELWPGWAHPQDRGAIVCTRQVNQQVHHIYTCGSLEMPWW